MAHHGVDQDEYRRLSDLLAVGLAVVSTRQGPHDLLVTVDIPSVMDWLFCRDKKIPRRCAPGDECCIGVRFSG